MAHLVSLVMTLALAWLLLSGHYTPLLLGLGAASVMFVVWLTRRMAVVDDESQPLRIALRAPRYWLWLLGQILLSNLAVARRILRPRADIAPRLFRVPVTNFSEMAQVVYANSITLTPGTVSVRVVDNEIIVHALTENGESGLRDGDMGARVQRLEGGS